MYFSVSFAGVLALRALVHPDSHTAKPALHGAIPGWTATSNLHHALDAKYFQFFFKCWRLSLLGARTLLVAPGLTARSKKLLGTTRLEAIAIRWEAIAIHETKLCVPCTLEA